MSVISNRPISAIADLSRVSSLLQGMMSPASEADYEQLKTELSVILNQATFSGRNALTGSAVLSFSAGLSYSAAGFGGFTASVASFSVLPIAAE